MWAYVIGVLVALFYVAGLVAIIRNDERRVERREVERTLRTLPRYGRRVKS